MCLRACSTVPVGVSIFTSMDGGLPIEVAFHELLWVWWAATQRVCLWSPLPSLKGSRLRQTTDTGGCGSESQECLLGSLLSDAVASPPAPAFCSLVFRLRPHT
jgi:hypothetical protein